MKVFDVISWRLRVSNFYDRRYHVGEFHGYPKACMSGCALMPSLSNQKMVESIPRMQSSTLSRACMSLRDGGLPRYGDYLSFQATFAEAASLGMYASKWAAAATLLQHLEFSHISVGEQGERIASLILLLARDNALKVAKPLPRSIRLDFDGQQRVVYVVDFLHSLLNYPSSQWQNLLPTHFRTKKDKTKTLKYAFKDASVWFNHFIQVEDIPVIGEDYLWHSIVRGAAVVCAKGHSGLDIVIPVLFKNKLMKSNVSAILVQMNNDPKYTESVDNLFSRLWTLQRWLVL